MKIKTTAHALFTRQTQYEMRHYFAFSMWTRLEDQRSYLLVAYYLWVEGAKVGEAKFRPFLGGKGQNVTTTLLASGEAFGQPIDLDDDSVEEIIGFEAKASLTFIQKRNMSGVDALLSGLPFSQLLFQMRQYDKAPEDNSLKMDGVASLYHGSRDEHSFIRDGTPFDVPNNTEFGPWTRASARWPGPHPFGE
jgi:hypothetical protein